MSADFFLDFFVLVLVVFFVFVFFPLASVASVVVVVDVEALDFEPVLLSPCAKASVANIRGRTNIPVKSKVVSFFMLIISSIVGGFIPPI